MRLTVFDCEDKEIHAFRTLSPRFGIETIFTESPIEQYIRNPELWSRCISISHKMQITASDLHALHGTGVSCICTRSIGYDHIDTDTAARLGILVQNTPYLPDGVADYTVMLMLMAIRGIRPILLRTVHNDFRLNAERGKELHDMTVGIVGFGRIGRAVKERLAGFGCRILLCDPDGNADCIPLCSLLKESDIVTLHAPLTAETYHMMDEEQFHLMKRDAILINTGRGALLNTQALIAALENGSLGGAALDVLEDEQKIFYCDHTQDGMDHACASRLSALPNVIITPHTAYYTDRVLFDTVEKTLINCLNFERRQSNDET